MNALLKPIESIYNINSNLLINSFSEISAELSTKRPNKRTNSMMFLLLHTIDARYSLLKELGLGIKNPFAKYVDWSNTIDDITKYPNLKSVLIDWRKTDSLLIDKFNKLTSKQLSKKLPMNFPGGNKAIHMIAFFAEHEAYHVGQLAFIRKFLGLKAVTF